MTASVGALPGFSDRVLRFLERVEHRIARTDCEREAAFRLRHDAYVRNDLMQPRPDRRLFDKPYDTAANAWITTTFVDGELAATTRLNLGIGEDCILPSMAVYPDVVAPRLKAGFVILETTRLAANISNFGVESGSRLSCDASGLYGRGAFRHRPRGRFAPPRTHGLLPPGSSICAMVRAAPLSWSDREIRLHGRRVPGRASSDRGALPLLQVRSD
jgi:hypothetical protein